MRNTMPLLPAHLYKLLFHYAASQIQQFCWFSLQLGEIRRTINVLFNF